MCRLLTVLIPLRYCWLQAIGVNQEIGVLFGDLRFLEVIVKGILVSGAGDGCQIREPLSGKRCGLESGGQGSPSSRRLCRWADL
jgi:hypothetical protein